MDDHYRGDVWATTPPETWTVGPSNGPTQTPPRQAPQYPAQPSISQPAGGFAPPNGFGYGVANDPTVKIPNGMQPGVWSAAQPISQPVSQPVVQPSAAKNKRSPWLAIGLSVAAFAVIAGVVFGALYLSGKIGKKNSAPDGDGRYLLKDSVFSVCLDGKWGFMDEKGNVVIDCQYDSVSNFTDGLARVQKNERYGYIDLDGDVVIEPVYHQLGFFSCGLACAQKNDGDKYCYLNTKGDTAIAAQFDDAYDFQDETSSAVVVVGDVFGWIDTTGKYVVNPQFEAGDYNASNAAYSISDGIIPITNGDKYGYIDSAGNQITAFDYAYAWPFISENSSVTIVDKGLKHGLINRQGTLVVDCIYDYLTYLDGHFFGFCTEQDGKFGLMSETGEIIAEPQFDALDREIDDNLFRCSVGGKYGLIDKSGAYVVNPTYDDIRWASGDLIPVLSNGKWGYLSTTGQQVIAPGFDKASDFLTEAGVAAVSQNGQWGLIDKNGQYISSDRYKRIFTIYDDKYAVVLTSDNLVKVVDFEGNILTSDVNGVRGSYYGPFSFNDYLEDVEHYYYADVSDDGLTCSIESKYYEYSKEYDYGFDCMTDLMANLGLSAEFDALWKKSGNSNTGTYKFDDLFDIRISYQIVSNQVTFTCTAIRRDA